MLVNYPNYMQINVFRFVVECAVLKVIFHIRSSNFFAFSTSFIPPKYDTHRSGLPTKGHPDFVLTKIEKGEDPISANLFAMINISL